MGDERGQSLAEVIIAATVGILVVSALTFATIYSLRNANAAKTAAQVTKLAQEGIEMVRLGRDRNSNISISGVSTVDSWNGSGPVWNYQITAAAGCDSPTTLGGTGGKCYFNVDSNTGALSNIGGFAFLPTPNNPLPPQAEGIPATNPIFKRVVLLSDDSSAVRLADGTTVPSYQVQKKVTVIVSWVDFAGLHESKLVTILRKL